MRTIGPRVGSKSARVPESCRSLTVTAGLGVLLVRVSGLFWLGSSGLLYLNRYQVVDVGVVATPGQATASVPQETTTVFFGVPKTTYECLAGVFVDLGAAAWRSRVEILRRLAIFVL